MPNFHMHWLVALQAADSLSDDAEQNDIATGRNKYFEYCSIWRNGLYGAVQTAKSVSDFRGKFVELTKKLEDNLRKPPYYDPITCFSAYMLGACGPDFWTLMSKEGFPSGDHVAGIHFDFGHYNRTHRQFTISGDRLRANKKWTLSERVERAYFAGMATHVATDLVLHELVNVYAGAYNILKHCWESEHGSTACLKNLWSTHNKVEHYWDTYVRYRWLGDYGTVWSTDEAPSEVHPRLLPLADTLLRDAKLYNPTLGEELAELFTEDKSQKHGVDLAGPPRHVDDQIRSKADRSLRSKIKENEATAFKSNLHYLLERPIIFPRIFCDRLLARKEISPFIYEVVVAKRDTTAYPPSDVFQKAIDEATTEQMNDIFNGGRNESNKLKTFSSRTNLGDDFNSFNFQIYFMCPRLARLRKYGPTVFWEPKALSPFIKTATAVAGQFATAFTRYADSQANDIGVLRNFWNLDTGLGLQIQNVASHSLREIRTRIKLPHVTEVTNLSIAHERADEYIGHKGKPAKYDLPGKYGFKPDTPAFDVVDGGPFDTTYDVYESSAQKYLRTINTTKEHGAPLREMTLDEFFAPPSSAPPVKAMAAGTDSVEPNTVVRVYHPVTPRLTLELEVPIVRLGQGEVTGFALYTDKAGVTAQPQPYEEKAAEKWLDKKRSQCLRFIEGSQPLNPDVQIIKGRAHYTARILLNPDVRWAKIPREIAKDKWNNVVNAADVKNYCGKNFAVATCRRHVLKQDGDGEFWADKDFLLYTDLTPTEQVFITLYALVRTAKGCFDICTGKQVTRSDFDKARKIQCVGFVPIVLLYVCDDSGLAQLGTSFIDALEVKVISI